MCFNSIQHIRVWRGVITRFTPAIIDTWHPTGQPVDASLYGADSHSDVVKHISSVSVCVCHETNKQKPWLRHYCAHCPCARGPWHHPVHSRYVDARGVPAFKSDIYSSQVWQPRIGSDRLTSNNHFHPFQHRAHVV